MTAFSRSLSKEVVSDTIRINVLSPGMIATDMQDRVSAPGQIAGAGATIPMGRVGTNDARPNANREIASVAAWGQS